MNTMVEVVPTAAATTTTPTTTTTTEEWSLMRDGDALAVSALGATITSWTARGKEVLFLSVNAKTSGPEPVNGGIPLVFPHFGEWDQGRPLHGFALRSLWTLVETSACSGAEKPCRLRLKLEDSPESRALWNHPFRLIYSIEMLEDSRLALTLQVENTGQADMAFHQLFHPYFKVNVEQLVISGLRGAQYIDKTNNFVTETEQRDVVIDRHTDFVYMTTEKRVQSLVDGEKRIRIEKSANLPDTVVWNPHETWSRHGLAEGEQRTFVCVEPGHVAKHVRLGAGQQWTSQLILSVEDLV